MTLQAGRDGGGAAERIARPRPHRPALPGAVLTYNSRISHHVKELGAVVAKRLWNLSLEI